MRDWLRQRWSPIIIFRSHWWRHGYFLSKPASTPDPLVFLRFCATWQPTTTTTSMQWKSRSSWRHEKRRAGKVILSQLDFYGENPIFSSCRFLQFPVFCHAMRSCGLALRRVISWYNCGRQSLTISSCVASCYLSPCVVASCNVDNRWHCLWTSFHVKALIRHKR